jgi:hypothetical protein
MFNRRRLFRRLHPIQFEEVREGACAERMPGPRDQPLEMLDMSLLRLDNGAVISRGRVRIRFYPESFCPL